MFGPTTLELRLLLCEDKFNESNVSHASACVWSVILGWVDALGTIKPKISLTIVDFCPRLPDSAFLPTFAKTQDLHSRSPFLEVPRQLFVDYERAMSQFSRFMSSNDGLHDQSHNCSVIRQRHAPNHLFGFRQNSASHDKCRLPASTHEI